MGHEGADTNAAAQRTRGTMMFDANEAFGRNSDPVGLRMGLKVPPEHLVVRNSVVNKVCLQNGNGEISDEAIRDALSRVLESSIFAQSRRLSRFLRFTVEAALAHKEEMLKEYVIGIEVYQRKSSYQPAEDGIVRSEAYRLRSKLKTYYESVGKDDPVFIYYRVGSYAPVFQFQHCQNGSGIVQDAAPRELFVDGRGIRIAVLPFVDASSGNFSSACAPIITDELIHELVRTEGLRVTAASSMVAQPRDIPAIARKLDVQIVFDGTVRQDQNQLLVMSRIINADGFQIWSERFETDADHHRLFKLSEKIVSALVRSIRPRTVVNPETKRLSPGGERRFLSFDLAKPTQLSRRFLRLG
jgi:TolB-like protein